MTSKRVPVVCGLALSLACETGAPPSTSALPSRSWVSDSTPTVDIVGTAREGEAAVGHAIGATRLSTGAIVVADALGHAVHFFDSTGARTRVVGRQGSGPGEFSAISWLGQCRPDSVYVWDFMQQRMTVIDRTGRVVRQFRLPLDPGDGPPPATLACSSDGLIAYLGRPDLTATESDRGDFARSTAPLLAGSLDGRVVELASRVPVVETSRHGDTFRLRPLGKRAQLAAAGNLVYLGTQDSGFVDVYEVGVPGRSTLSLGAMEPRPVTQEHYDRAIAADLVWMPSADARRRLRESLVAIPMPDVLPPYSQLLSDREGNIWAVLSSPGDSMTSLRAVAPDGTVLGDLQIPAEIKVLEVGRGYVLGVQEEQNGEQRIQLYRYRRRSRS